MLSKDAQFKAIYIDTKQKFRPERVQEITRSKNYTHNILSDIFLVKPLNTAHLENLISESVNRIETDKSIKLLIIDSLVSLYRSEFIGRKNLVERQNRLGRLLNILSKASDVYNIAVVVTNHVQSSADSFSAELVKPTGGNIVGHLSTHGIFLSGSGDRRRARITNSPCLPPNDAIFCITNEGIVNYQENN